MYAAFLFYNSYEDNQHSNVMKIRKVSLSNNDGDAVSSNIEQKTIIDTSSPVTDSRMNLDDSCVTSSVICIESLIATKDDANVISEVPIMHSISKITPAESLHRKLDNSNDSSPVKDERINAHNTTQDLNHHAYISNPENDGASMPQNFPKRLNSNISLGSTNGVGTLRYKVLLVFAVCCIIGCCLMPTIFYYVSQTKSRVAATDPEYSHRKNNSAKVSYGYMSYRWHVTAANVNLL